MNKYLKFENQNKQGGRSISLISRKNTVIEYNSLEPVSEQTTFLKPRLVGKSKKGKQIYFQDSQCSPDCLRFCPANSSNQIEISLSGFTAKAKAAGQTARSNKGFSKGIHFWEFVCTVCCSSINIGVTNKTQTLEALVQFRTSTPRVVGIELNLETNTLNFWINGRALKERQKKLQDGNVWYPTIKFKEPGYSVTLNPFGQGRGIEKDMNNNYLPSVYYPQLSKFSIQTLKQKFSSEIFTKYTQSLFNHFLFVHSIPYFQKEQDFISLLSQFLHSSEFNIQSIYHHDYKDLYQDKPNYALIKFENEVEAAKYFNQFNSSLKLFTSSHISLLLSDPKEVKEKMKNFPDDIDKLRNDVIQLLKDKVLQEQEFQVLDILGNLEKQPISNEDMSKTLQEMKLQFENPVPQEEQKSEPQSINSLYNDKSDTLILIKDAQLKLLHRTQGIFDIDSYSHFSHFPKSETDIVKLNISSSSIQFLITHIDWNQLEQKQYQTLNTFIAACKNTNGSHILIEYIYAIQSVQILLNIAIGQYEKMEDVIQTLQEKEILSTSTRDFKQKKLVENQLGLEFQQEISIIDCHEMMSVIMSLEDQLWAMVQDDNTPQSVSYLLKSTGSRTQTAYGRLSSFITTPLCSESIGQFNPRSLSEMGLYNSGDNHLKISMYQDFRVELENIFISCNQSKNDLHSSLEKQFPHNLLLKGLPTWNVPLAQTLNSLPPQVHTNGLKQKELQKEERVEFVKQIGDSDFVMSGSRSGAVNVWNTKVKMQLVAGQNFAQKKYNSVQKEDLQGNKAQLVQYYQKLMEYEEQKFQGKLPSDQITSLFKNNRPHQSKHVPKTQDTADDLLFTMFDEQEEAELIIDDEVSMDSGDEAEYLAIIGEQVEKTKAIEMKEEVKEEKKEETKVKEKTKEKEEVVIPKEDLLTQLLMMGFNIDVSKQSLIKVKNESLSAALDAVMELQNQQEKHKVKIPQQFVPVQTKIQSWECTVCTYINVEGKAQCEMCTNAAPTNAYVQVKSEDQLKKEQEEAQRLKQEEEDKIRHQQELFQKMELMKKQKEKEEEEIISKLNVFFQSEQVYYGNIEVKDYIFAGFKGGKDARPLMVGAVYQNKIEERVDIQIMRLGYVKRSYLDKFTKMNGKNQCGVCDMAFTLYSSCLEHVLSLHQDIVECYYPIFLQKQLVSPVWNERVSKHTFKTLKGEENGIIIWPFKELESFAQIGDNITIEKPMFLVGVGKDKKGVRKVIVQRVSLLEDEMKVETLSDDSSIFKDIAPQIDQIYVSYTPIGEILFVKNGNSIKMFQVLRSNNDFTLKVIGQTIDVNQDEHVINYTDSQLILQNNQQLVRTLSIQLDNEQSEQLQKNAFVQESQLNEEQILKQHIDPKNVTICDLQRYEKLMNGKSVGAQSNATNQMNGGKNLQFSKHYWLKNEQNGEQPMEIVFEQPTSLISLNIEMLFNHNQNEKLVEEMKVGGVQKEGKVNDVEQIDTSSVKVKSDSTIIQSLGLLSIQQISEEIMPSSFDHQPISQPDIKVKGQLQFLPLLVNNFKGASFEQSFTVCKMLTDNNMMFASNYPRPEYQLKHLHNHIMNIDKIVVRSHPNQKCGATPIGSGIIFLSDNISAFEMTTPFHKFNKAQYQEWKQNRLKNPMPLMNYEPAAFFSFEGNEQSVTVDVDFKRSARFIYFKPTSFRKITNGPSSNFNDLPIEIEFFGVSGSSQEVSTISSNDSESDITYMASKTDYSLKVEVISTGDLIKSIEQIEVEKILGANLYITPSTLISLSKNLSGKMVGRTQIKITDSKLQLQKIPGLKISLKGSNTSNWTLRGVSIQAIVSDQDSSNLSQQNPLFSQQSIPTEYLRSCLLSPKYFSVINKQLTQILSSEDSDQQLRMHIVKFLNKLMKVDKDFVQLVMQEIKLDSFLDLNLFSRELNGLQQVFELLSHFQKDTYFCNNLYQILSERAQNITEVMMQQQGYDALIGMLKWVSPLHPERTIESLLSTLYKKLCLSKLESQQSKECINFRSRYNINSFPFDQRSFKAGIEKTQDQKMLYPQSVMSHSKLLPVEQIKKMKSDYQTIYYAKFPFEVVVSDLKLYLGMLETGQYKINVKMFSSGKLCFFQTFDEVIFSQFAHMVYAKQEDQQNDALHLTNLDIQGADLQVLIDFSVSSSTIPKSLTSTVSKIKPPDTIIELYGNPVNPLITDSQIKDIIDKRAQIYWQSKGKLFQIGRSLPYLQVLQDTTESHLVPQGSQVQNKPVEEEQKKEVQSESSLNHQIQKSKDLELLQEELKGKIKNNDFNVKEIVQKIEQLQGQIQVDNGVCVQYYMQVATDFTKLIRRIIKTNKVNKEKLSSIFREQEEDLSVMCFELFKRFIAFDQGEIRSDIQLFIIEILYPIMLQEEKKSFSFRVISEFLSSLHTEFSQKAILESLNTIGMPEGELIAYMLQKLNIGGKAVKAENIHPFIFMSSVFILALNSLKRIVIPEPGLAMHQGIGCSMCGSKMIIGWRFKCGTCIGDYNFDEKCSEKHIQDHPDHVLIVIQDQLPYKSKPSKQQKQLKAVLPKFEFKEQVETEVVHSDVNCENCGKKPITGNCYKCINCEDFSLCSDCYQKNSYSHFSYHMFMKLQRALKQTDKNPITMLQVLDPMLYPQINYSPEKSPSKKDEDDLSDDFEDLIPFEMSRSLSVPLNNMEQKNRKVEGTVSDKLELDDQFIVLFNTCVWICQDPSGQFSVDQKVVLLKLSIDTLLQIVRLVSVDKVFEVVSNKSSFFSLLVSILQLNNKDLLHLFRSLCDNLRQPPSHERSLKESKIESLINKKQALTSEKKQHLNEEMKVKKLVLKTMLANIQSLLKWIVDVGLNPELAKLQIPNGQEPQQLFQAYTQSQQIWLDHLQFTVELFIKTNDELKDSSKPDSSDSANQLEKIPEENNDEEEEDLLPMNMARSISVPTKKNQDKQVQQSHSVSLQLIKSLIQLLHLNDSQAKKVNQFKQTEAHTKYLSLMWSLVLKSLTTVSINQLIDAKIFESLVSAFLISTEDIQQITYPQILSISETIAKQTTHSNDISKFISNLLFTTLENVTNNHHEKVGYSICQGWLDILISSTTARNPETEKKDFVYAKMNGDEMSTFMKRTAQYLIQYLNKGNLEGVAGCTPDIVLRLNLAVDLLHVIRYSQSKSSTSLLAIQELFQSHQVSIKLRKELQDSFDYLLAWLFLNSRTTKDEASSSLLGNASNTTPATAASKRLTEIIQDTLMLISDSYNNEQIVKIALSSLTTVVKKMTNTILELSSNNSLGFDVSVRLSNKTNEYFIQFLKQWLTSDSIASYFVFDLAGFEFLLDTIGLGGEKSQRKRSIGDNEDGYLEKNEEVKVVQEMKKDTGFDQMEGSDLSQYLENILQSRSGFQIKQEKAKVAENQNIMQAIAVYDPTTPLQVQEYAKSLSMISSNGSDLSSSYQKTDWSVNKRAYKHRIIIKYLTGQLRNEYWMFFSLPSPIELKEIQIGFTNYWGADTETFVEPLSVLVEAGMDENNLSLICNLHLIKDDAFGSVSATVFGKNLQTFTISSQPEQAFQQIEDIIQSKLKSVQNFKVQYIKFCMRRFAMTCIENSPLSTKFTKQPAFGVNYISLLGYEMNKIGDYVSYIKQEQKKTALEVLSIICSGDFQSILKVIANQKQTVDKMKKSFNLLASLVSIKKNLIEPTFIAISAYNTEMGDWIINQFLSTSNIYNHPSLVGEIVMCNKQELPRRLLILQNHVMNELALICNQERSNHGTAIKKLLPFIQIFIQTLRISSPELMLDSTMLGTSETQLVNIVSLLSGATQEREEQTQILTQLLVLLLYPPHPFRNDSVDPYKFVLRHLLKETEAGESQQQKESLASVLSATSRDIALEILKSEKNLGQLFLIGQESQDIAKITHCLKFWYNVSQDHEVKSQLLQRNLPLILYKSLREDVPQQNNKIIKSEQTIGESELQLIVEFIKFLISGEPKFEQEIAELLKKDLEHLGQIRDMNFVNKVFLQLLREEYTVPICLWPFDSENKKWLPTYKPMIVADNSNQNASNNNVFLPSSILQGETRSVFIKNFKEIVGASNKPSAKKLLSSNWQLAHTQTENGTLEKYQAFWKSIESKSPIIILVTCEQKGGTDKSIYGCYSSKGVPNIPANLAQDCDFPVPASPEDFAFCYIDDKSFHHFKPKVGVNMLTMFTDYEGGGAISVANDFILISYSYDFVFTVGVQYDLEKIQESSNPKPLKQVIEQNMVFTKFEIWTPSGVPVQPIPQPPKPSIQVQPMEEFKHPWCSEISPFKKFRTNPVFLAPAHLTLGQLSTILLGNNVTFKVRHNMEKNSQKEDLKTLNQELQQQRPLCEMFNQIIDLEYEINQLLNVQTQDDSQSKPDLEESGMAMIAGYIPQMGLFERFEAQGGVKQIISVTLASLNMWKQQDQAQSWSLWLRELESFSEIPLFFQLFLKNSKSKDLLFKVLAGQPDSEISADLTKKDIKTKWEEEQKSAVQFNYRILSDAFSISNDLKLREIALQCGLLPRILERLGSISGEKARVYEEKEEEKKVEKLEMKQEQQSSQIEKNVDKKKRKGVGYSSKVGQTFNVVEYLENKKVRNDQIKNLIDICSSFLTSKVWKADEEVLNFILESPLLPLLESAFRNGSWLEMAKESQVYHSYLALTRAIASQKKLIPCLIELDQKYKPSQTEPIYKLLQKLNELAEIFINCLNQQEKSEQDSQIPEKLAKDVIKTYKIVWQQVSKLNRHQSIAISLNPQFSEDDHYIENALTLPLAQSYRVLLQDLRFDYMDMKDPLDQSGTVFKHHYQSIALQNQNPPASKMVRLAQELADLSNALPYDHTNAIFVRVDQSRVDMMKGLVCGASNTPYAHGCYEFDIFCDNNYPREPPKMNLITTGGGSVRFNPNLYACGKVCLSLLGTWRGSATENWDPKLSTILQVLLSTQAIIMSEEVYFNEPGFENEAGTPEGEKKNEGYSNIVRYANIKFAMIEQLKNPSKGFESVIKRHFYLKKQEIMTEVNQWMALAEKNEAAYAGLVNDHNSSWAAKFKTSTTKYKEMLQQAVKELETLLNNLERPSEQELKQQQQKQNSKRHVGKSKRMGISDGKIDFGEVDVGTDDEGEQINTESKKEMNINDEAVKDRWSRYIGAMGVEAVAKQSAANIFLTGAGALGIEIAKNLVLAGCKSFTLHDCQPISYRDLSGQFFINMEEDMLNDKKKKHTRGEACFPRLQQLNYYVRCKLSKIQKIPLDVKEIESEEWGMQNMDVVIATECSYEEIAFLDRYCRERGKKFINAEQCGAFGRIFNDFGDKFEVMDKNGEDLQDVMIKGISNEEFGVVELLQTNKHKFEDGDEVHITGVKGMNLIEGQENDEKSLSINDTIHKVTVMTPYSFKIGDTRKYEKYELNGIAKQLKTKREMEFSSFEDTMLKGNNELKLDGNMSISDWEKMSHNMLSHIAFEAMDEFKKEQKRMPGVWNREDAELFFNLSMKVGERYEQKVSEWTIESYEFKFLYLFSFTSQGVLNPLCAYLGGFVAQECIKAITQKFSPIQQLFYYDAFEILPDFSPKLHLTPEFVTYISDTVKPLEQSTRYDGLRIIVGQDLLDSLAYTRLFMVGAGAIGCELLKNYAMLGVGIGKKNKKHPQAGQIVLTDPDVIEVSNLNRQFLFREKHLRKPKSQTAAASVVYMNRDLSDNIIARLDKVHEGTSNIFSDQFFEEITVVTNALDNVQARRYIDIRCVTAKTPLLESGTLGPKGHVQVVLPYKTESYGSMNDPEDNNEIPICTLKMFPEETLHCVEWALDKFGKLFTQGPKNTLKLLEEGKSFTPTSQQDAQSMKETIKILKKRPKSFEQCIEYARVKFEKLFNHDIQQLMHVYPLDAKTKEGNPFWALPKRPPTPVIFDPQNPLHQQFISSIACLRATVFKIKIPSEAPRSDQFKKEVAALAILVKVPAFVINDEKAKEIQASVNKQVKEEKKGEEEKKEEEESSVDQNDIQLLLEQFHSLITEIPQPSKSKTYSETLMSAEEFEKDNDQNYHIDFMFAMANCRAQNYKLDPMDWITVKLKAGRIVPALATTTASIAGLQTLELIKLLKGCKKTDHRNIFLNLAVPMMQASEPGDVQKVKLTESIEVTLWDRWEVKLGKDVRLIDIIQEIEKQKEGLEVRDIMKGNLPLYFHAIASGVGKEKEKEKLMKSKLMEMLNCDEEKYVDINVTCVKKGDSEEKIVNGVPCVRVFFE